MRYLLTEAQKALTDQRSPFVSEWLVEHDVTGDECYDLSLQIASSIGFTSYSFRRLGSDPTVKKLIVDWLMEETQPDEPQD